MRPPFLSRCLSTLLCTQAIKVVYISTPTTTIRRQRSKAHDRRFLNPYLSRSRPRLPLPRMHIVPPLRLGPSPLIRVPPMLLQRRLTRSIYNYNSSSSDCRSLSPCNSTCFTMSRHDRRSARIRRYSKHPTSFGMPWSHSTFVTGACAATAARDVKRQDFEPAKECDVRNFA